MCQYEFAVHFAQTLCHWPKWADCFVRLFSKRRPQGGGDGVLRKSHVNARINPRTARHICSEALIYVTLMRQNNLLKGQDENVSHSFALFPFRLFHFPDIHFSFRKQCVDIIKWLTYFVFTQRFSFPPYIHLYVHRLPRNHIRHIKISPM